jgi:hypothetical protein
MAFFSSIVGLVTRAGVAWAFTAGHPRGRRGGERDHQRDHRHRDPVDPVAAMATRPA